VPPRRPINGRHRRKKKSAAPAYFTAATLAAFAVSGLNVPGAIGAIGAMRDGSATTTQPQTQRPRAESALAAAQLRNRIAGRSEARASRLRTAQQEAITAAQVAASRAKAAVEAQPKWVLPITGYRLTAGFGMVSGLWSHAHTGQDFAAPVGTPIRAVGDGVIIFASYDGAYGNKIVIRHPDGTVTWYCHMNEFARTEGAVEAGDLIGRVGSTGNTTGPHLHFEVRLHGEDSPPIEPMAWLRAHGLHP
jgi:murein DD-endopeptidase MepM/ murein hydrolase activator NlpD